MNGKIVDIHVRIISESIKVAERISFGHRLVAGLAGKIPNKEMREAMRQACRVARQARNTFRVVSRTVTPPNVSTACFCSAVVPVMASQVCSREAGA